MPMTLNQRGSQANGKYHIYQSYKKVQQVSSNVKKTMLIFHDFNGTVHMEFVPPG